MKKDRFTHQLHRREAKSRRRRARKAARAATAVAIATGVAAGSAGPALAWDSGSGGGSADGKIAYDRPNLAAGSAFDVFKLDPDASSPPTTAVTESNDAAADTAPQWSPDGTQIAYVSTRLGDLGPQIYIQAVGNPASAAPVAGGQLVGIDPNTTLAWSPDSTEIAYAKGNAFLGVRDIYAVSIGTGTERQVTNDVADDGNPTWSGSKIAFESNRSGDYDIWRVDAGSQSNPVTEQNPVDIAPYQGSDEREPDYSPGGYLILFTSNKNDATNRDVYVKAAGTSTDNWRLTTNAAVESGPRFAPSGIRFTFASTRVALNSNDIFVQWLLPDTDSRANPRDVSATSNPEQRPDWQRIASSGGTNCRAANEQAKEDGLVADAVANNTSPLSPMLNNQQPSSSSQQYNASSDNSGNVSSECVGAASSDGGSQSGSDH